MVKVHEYRLRKRWPIIRFRWTDGFWADSWAVLRWMLLGGLIFLGAGGLADFEFSEALGGNRIMTWSSHRELVFMWMGAPYGRRFRSTWVFGAETIPQMEYIDSTVGSPTYGYAWLGVAVRGRPLVWWVEMPFWLAMILLAPVLVLVWRKARAARFKRRRAGCLESVL